MVVGCGPEPTTDRDMVYVYTMADTGWCTGYQHCYIAYPIGDTLITMWSYTGVIIPYVSIPGTYR